MDTYSNTEACGKCGKTKLIGEECEYCSFKTKNIFNKSYLLIIPGIFLAMLIFLAATSLLDNPANQEVQNFYSVNVPFMTKYFEVTVTSIEKREKVGGLFSKSPSDGGIYVVIIYKYKNITNRPIGLFSFPKLYLMHEYSSAKFYYDSGATSYFDEIATDSKILSDLNPGITSTDAKVFEIAKSDLSKYKWKLVINDKYEIPFSFMAKE